MWGAGERMYLYSSNHVGRSGEPIVLVVGDEAAPSAVGHTLKDGRNSCCWVIKKELEEVAKLLARINQEKKEWDKECRRRSHEFFIPNGSKIIVGSYVHLRREGLEGYIGDFNNIVRDVWQVMGEIGVEVLPYVPVVYKGIDTVGGELLAGVKNWILWVAVADQKERQSIRELAKTGGEEVSWRECSKVIYRPSFVAMSNRESSKEGEEGGWRNRGNRVDLVRGEWKEVELKSMLPARGIGKMLEERGMCGIDEEFEQEKRSSFSKGVSVEA